TVPYMSPEQLRGETVDARSDIFSFGVVIYELLSGRPAFGRGTDAETIGAILHEEPTELSPISPNLPEALEDVVRKCLAKDAAQRYQTMWQVAHDLNAARDGDQTKIKTPAARTVKADVAKRFKRSAALIAASVIAAVALFGYYSYFAKGGEAIDSIAVMPFVNVGNDPNAEYLSDGISDSIINSLSELPNLKKVIPFSSVLRHKGKAIDPQAVGRELNVGAVLTGRLALRGDEALVSTELVDVKDNKRIGGGQYSHKLGDVFKLQSEIAQDVSERLRLKVSGEEKERLTKPKTENAEAYQLYLQGLYYWRKNTDEATLKSGEYFQQAIEKDPNFALAYVGMADYYAVMANFGNMRANEAWPKAEAALVKALAIDERHSGAHRAMGAVKMFYDWDWPGAERELKRAIELDPEVDRGLYNRLLEATGRIDEAIADASVHWNQPHGSRLEREERLPKLLYLAGRYNEAIEGWRKILDKEPNRRGMAHLAIGEIYVRQGRYEEARAEMLEVRPRVRYPRELARIGYVYAAAGKRDEAIKILEEMRGLTGKRYNLSTHIAAIYAALGNQDEALAWLKRACDEHEQGVVDLKVDPRLDTLRSDQRFVDLLRRVKLAP
ncbi:MAG: protein kinase, partial [Rubrivivax sp.]|nr:protein kinase [Pyrinomonadaceae bacterium]